MTKSELLEKRNSTDKEFVSLLELAKVEKRQLTDEENSKVDALKEEIRKIDEEISVLEKTELKEIEAKRAKEAKDLEVRVANLQKEASLLEKTRNKNVKQNGIFKAFQERLNGSSRDAIISRAAVDGDTTAMADAIPNYVQELDILGYKPIWEVMGTDKLSGAQGTFTLPYEDPIVGAKLAELASATGDTVTPTGILVTPNRYTVQKTFTLETLNSATPQFINSVLADMVKGCDRAITKDVYTKALAVATAVAAGAITKTGFDALMAGAEVELEGSFLANRSTFFEAKSIAIDAGSGRFLVERAGDVSQGKGVVYDGTPFWYSNLFEDGTNQQYVVYGDTSKILVADYGMVEIIVDKFTKAGDGQVIITVNKIANVAAKNPNAFTKSPDLDAS